LRNRSAGIDHPKFEQTSLRLRTYSDRLIGRTMSQGIPDQIGDQLPDSGTIAVHRLVDVEIALEGPPRRRRAQFIDDLFQNVL
jgi:hypothetical protein